MSGRLIVVKPDGAIVEHRREEKGPPTLDSLQAIVGGYVEHRRVRWEGRVRDAFINEDGITKRLPHNRVATELLLAAGWAVAPCGALGNLAIWVPDAARRAKG